jgi:hypothetical protein
MGRAGQTATHGSGQRHRWTIGITRRTGAHPGRGTFLSATKAILCLDARQSLVARSCPIQLTSVSTRMMALKPAARHNSAASSSGFSTIA